MTGILGQPAKPYRHRRPGLRKYAFIAFVVIVIILWRSGRIGHSEYDEPGDSTGLRSRIKTAISPQEVPPQEEDEADLEDTPDVTPIQPVVRSRPQAQQAQPNVPKTGTRSRPLAKGQKLIQEEGAEVHDTDGIEAIKDSPGDTVDHAADMEQAGDDDSVGAEDEIVPEKVGDTSGEKTKEDLAREKAVDNLVKDIMATKPEDPVEADEEAPEEEPPQEALEEAGKEPLIADPLTPAEISKEQYQFPTWDECESVKEKADSLPDIVHVPFEDAVRGVELDGWEDEWVSKARYIGPKLAEPKIDFVYNWVNGSQAEFTETMRPYELNSSLNDPDGEWIKSHSTNRYREWDELRYSVRSVEKYASKFLNRIQFLVNAYKITDEDSPDTYGKQKPHWLRDDHEGAQVLSQEEFFGADERKCLPTFDSLTIENQIFNTPSDTDRLFALSDDMILGKKHAASDIYSPLFGPTMGFKTNAYNTLAPPTEKDAERFGEKPFLIYTSWLLNRRFGARKRKGQVHFGHSLGRSVTKEAIRSFPRPSLRSAFQRFRGETGFQLYSWYVIFHYTMERHREVLLWSYIMHRSDMDSDGYLDWRERKKILSDIAEGMSHDTPELYRKRLFYTMADHLKKAGLEPPKVNTNILWTSMDGPITIKDLDCDAFDTEDCLAPGFSIPDSDKNNRVPVFSAAAMFDRVARQSPRCGDCLIKLILNRRKGGLGPLLPHPVKKPEARATVVKALMRYQYTVVEPDALFYMVTDAEQAEHILLRPYIQHNKKAGQICLNDDVVTTDEGELERLRKVMKALFDGLLPDSSSFEK